MITLTPNQQQFLYWIKERDSIRRSKEAGVAKPWTDNVVLQNAYFCNVNREDDKVTKWIRQNWTYYGDGGDNGSVEEYQKYYTIAMMIARVFNLPSTLALVQQPAEMYWWLENAEEVLRELREANKPVWNGAYIISTNGKKIDKLTYCLELFRKAGEKPDIIDGVTTCAEAHKKLMTIEGLASFLAAQIVADLKNTKGHPLYYVEDKLTFSAHGPGSLRGLTWFWEKDIRPNTYQKAISDAYELIEGHLPVSVWAIMCMQNFQNCFCEYDKFMRVTNGTGRSKRKYPGV